MAKLTIEDLLAKKDRRQDDVKTVHLDGLGGELEVRRIPLVKFTDYMDRTQKGDAKATLEAQYEMIYACCPILHNEQLLEAYECKDPLDIVPKILRENIMDMNALVTAISAFYGVDLDDDLKN